MSRQIFRQFCARRGNAHGSAGALRSLEDLEREAIKATLEATHYKIGRAAEVLGISRKTLLEKRKKYGLIVRREVLVSESSTRLESQRLGRSR